MGNIKLTRGNFENIEGLPDINLMADIRDQFIINVRKTEENVINQVLTSLLKRVPTIEDYKDCCFLHYDDCEDWYKLTYRGLLLGKIIRSWPTFEDTKFNFMVIFEPAKQEEFLEFVPPIDKDNKK